MAWSKFFSLPTGFPAKVGKFGNAILNVGDPKVGHHLLQLQKPSLLARVHGEDIHSLYQKNGFHARASKENIMEVRHTDVENYQCYNINPFGWGACSSVKNLEVFMKKNRGLADKGWIYKFYSDSTSLLSLKIKAGMEVQAHDNENEELFIKHVPFTQFIAATCPQYREKFLAGELVPNAMHAYIADLPKTMRISDVYTEKDILSWLLVHGSEKTFTEISQYLYADIHEKGLHHRLGGNPALINAVNGILTVAKTSSLQL